MPSSHLSLGNTGPRLVFLSANGFPPECYRPLLTPLSEHFRVKAPYFLPLLQPEPDPSFRNWTPFVDKFSAWISTHCDGPVIGVGHSLGGTVLLQTALQSPEYFDRIILIEPALFSPLFSWLYRCFDTLGLSAQVHPLIRPAQRRHSHFKNKETVIQRWQNNPIFQGISPPHFEALIDGLFQDDEKGIGLRWPPKWEAKIYQTCCRLESTIWPHLSELSVPAHLWYAQHSNTIFPSCIKAIQKRLPSMELDEYLTSSHLLPFEYPNVIAKRIQTHYLP